MFNLNGAAEHTLLRRLQTRCSQYCHFKRERGGKYLFTWQWVGGKKSARVANGLRGPGAWKMGSKLPRVLKM